MEVRSQSSLWEESWGGMGTLLVTQARKDNSDCKAPEDEDGEDEKMKSGS